MKLIVWTTGLVSMYISSTNWLAAVAQCVRADVSVQYNISGSKQPTERTNDVELRGANSCRGNVSVTTGVQGNVGGNGRVRQTRVVRHRQENLNNKDEHYSSPTVEVQSNPAIDVYNPADNLNRSLK